MMTLLLFLSIEILYPNTMRQEQQRQSSFQLNSSITAEDEDKNEPRKTTTTLNAKTVSVHGAIFQSTTDSYGQQSFG